MALLLALLVCGVSVVIVTSLRNHSPWIAIGTEGLSPVDTQMAGAAVRRWYRSEALGCLRRREFAAAASWAWRSVLVNRMRMTSGDAREGAWTAEVGWSRGGRTKVDVTVGLTRISGVWSVESSAW